MKKRKPSERTLFERWLHEWCGEDLVRIRAQRTEYGYRQPVMDWAYMGWLAGRAAFPPQPGKP